MPILSFDRMVLLGCTGPALFQTFNLPTCTLYTWNPKPQTPIGPLTPNPRLQTLTPNHRTRFHLYRIFLDQWRDDYSLVLHTDVRDVLFQLDPFEEIEAHGGGVFFLESNETVIGKSYTNRIWLTRNCSVYHSEGVLSQVCTRSKNDAT